VVALLMCLLFRALPDISLVDSSNYTS
jgi:hypothetical protein